MKTRIIYFLFLLLLFQVGNGSIAVAQTAKISFTLAEVPMSINGQALQLVNGGGLNGGQFSVGDIDADGRQDLLVFDREANTGNVFTLIGGSYFLNEYLLQAIPAAEDWMLLRDYNGDGRPDLFVGENDNVKLYKNRRGIGGLPLFDLVTSALISTSFVGGPLEISVMKSDVPSIADVDGDGDLDIVCFEFAGATAEMHTNLSVEQTGGLEGITFRKSACWGRFAENPNQCDQYELGISCRVGAAEPPKPANVQHIGSTLTLLDTDGDGDKDALVGDISCPDVNLLQNSGTRQVANIGSVQSRFPAVGQRAALNIFPAATVADIDADGDDDFLVAPNVYSNALSQPSDFRRSAYLFTNTGTNAAPNYAFQRADFLQKEAGDLGGKTTAVFIDMDGDGDQDMVEGHTDIRNAQSLVYSRLSWWQNTGVGGASSFTLQDTLLFGFQNLSNEPIRPVAADFDGDGDQDLGLMQTSATGHSDLKWTTNTGTIGANGLLFDFAAYDTAVFNFAFGDHPAFYDIDNDGDLDMLLGKENGALSLYEKVGPDYILLSGAYLGLARNPRRRDMKSAIGLLNDNNLPDLILSDDAGRIVVFADPIFNSSYRALPDTLPWKLDGYGAYFSFKPGEWASPNLADINADGKLDLMLGMGGGGRRFFTNTSGIPLSAAKAHGKSIGQSNLKIAEQQGNNLTVISTQLGKIQFWSITGSALISNYLPAGASTINTSTLPAGFYLIEWEDKQSQQTQKWLKR